MPRFDDLGDEEKVAYSEAEIATTLARLDDLIDQLAALRTEVEDHDGLVRFTLGDDGRLLELFVDETVGDRLTNLALEETFNVLLARGNEAVQQNRQRWRDRMRGFGSGLE